MKRFFSKNRRRNLTLPEKANRVLNTILILFFLVMVRLWHVAVTQHEEKLAEAQRPQRRTVIERAERAPIFDREGVALALNKVQHNVSISYSQIRKVPRTVWRKNSEGKKIKHFKRKEYITQLAHFLGEELNLDANEIEDLIHAKASIFGSVPFLIKENISEKKYFKLRMKEKDWPGLNAEMSAKRCYPLGRTASSVIGYMGAISKTRYDALTKEMQQLRERLTSWEEGVNEDPHPFFSIEEANKRLKMLEAKAYSINDFVGKSGVEAAFDESLKGSRGKRTFLADIRGRFLQELPGGVESQGGDSIRLTVSAKLQEYAESLLAEYEATSPPKKELYPENHPWVKGGAIVVLEPNTGEVFALASTSRFDPNDFIRGGTAEEKRIKTEAVSRWLESENYLGKVYDGVLPLIRERFSPNTGTFYDEEMELTWEAYLNSLFPKKAPIQSAFRQINNLELAVKYQVELQNLFEHFLSGDEISYPNTAKVLDYLYPTQPTNTLLTLQDKERFASLLGPEVDTLKEPLDLIYSSLTSNVDKLLLADLCRMVVDPSSCTSTLVSLVGSQTLSDFRKSSSALVSVSLAVKRIVRELYLEHDFRAWRENSFKEFLSKKRGEEKKNKRYAKPYTDYLHQEEQKQFQTFWERNKYRFLMTFLTLQKGAYSQEREVYQEALLTWAQEVVNGGHTALGWVHFYHALKEITDEFHPSILMSYFRALRSFSDLDKPLWGCYIGLRSSGGKQYQRHLACAFYPKYGYGVTRPCSFAQATRVGSIFKLIPSYAVLMQRHTEGRRELNPLVMVDDKRRAPSKNGGWIVGYEAGGRPIPLYYRGGRLPRSDHSGIGRIDLRRALETSSNPFFSLVAGDLLQDPEDLCHAARLFSFGAKTGIDLPGEFAGYIPKDVTYNRTGLYSMAIGQHSLLVTPLQTATMLAALANGGKVLKPQIRLEAPTEVRWTLSLPDRVREELLSGMRQVVQGEKGTARILRQGHCLSSEQRALVPFVVGKTSTAEVGTRLSLDSSATHQEAKIIKDVGFGAIYFEDATFKCPKLVVVIFLRRGDWGKEAAPLAIKMIHKYKSLSH